MKTAPETPDREPSDTRTDLVPDPTSENGTFSDIEVVDAPFPAELDDAVSKYAKAARAESTKKQYRAEWERYVLWCVELRRCPLPSAPATLAAYATHLAEAGKAPATIDRIVTTIATAHLLARQPDPRDRHVREVLSGIRRARKRALRQADPLLPEHIRKINAALWQDLPSTPPDLYALRSRAIVLLGFAGAFRRSELAALDAEDLAEHEDGLVVCIRKSKTDQLAKGAKVGIARGTDICPVGAVTAWCEAAKLTEGPLFRRLSRHGTLIDGRASAKMVDRTVKHCARAAQLEGQFSAHSLRAGFATAAANAGVGDHRIAQHGRWSSLRTVERYVRHVRTFNGDNLTRDLLRQQP
jgi:integrase